MPSTGSRVATDMQIKGSNLQPSAAAAAAGFEDKQRRRMLVALFLLLLALVVVLIKDRQFWFSSTPRPESPTEEASTSAPPASQSAAISNQPAQSAIAAKSRKLSSKRTEPDSTSQVTQPQPPAGPVITATNRTVLPPLEVEVVAGNSHRALSPKNNSVNVDMGPSPFAGLAAPPAPAAANNSQPSPAPVDQGETLPASDPSARVTLPPATAERVSRSVKPGYPMLAKQMRVQGAVVLQALIDRAGGIEELHVVSGPAILASAAQEAVKQWHFKPYYQQGQPVETEARITVNFTISTY